jgi:hypothetical protein
LWFSFAKRAEALNKLKKLREQMSNSKKLMPICREIGGFVYKFRMCGRISTLLDTGVAKKSLT